VWTPPSGPYGHAMVSVELLEVRKVCAEACPRLSSDLLLVEVQIRESSPSAEKILSDARLHRSANSLQTSRALEASGRTSDPRTLGAAADAHRTSRTGAFLGVEGGDVWTRRAAQSTPCKHVAHSVLPRKLPPTRTVVGGRGKQTASALLLQMPAQPSVQQVADTAAPR